MTSENNKRIARNTLFLYFRMLLTMGVSLYTSRVVLNALGIDDFGIYGVVGSIIAMFGFLNSSMASATSRFLTFELGRKDYEKLRKTFSAALTVHFIVAVIILILGETIGLWWLENKLVIAPDRMNAAQWVFHLSVFASVIAITQAPYNATIIAHERMNVYAYVEILNSLLKLGIVFLLVIGSFDKLILYAALTLCVTIIITMIYKIYCTANFPESHYRFHWDKKIIKPIIGFLGWSFLGYFSFTLKTQGVNMLLNLFFGVILNAAYGIAAQIKNALMGFSSNFLQASRPQIVKYYASGNILSMKNLVINVSKYSFLLMLLISFPVIMEGHFILNLWLKKVPDYAVSFAQLNLLYGIIWTQMVPFGQAIHATGKIKIHNIINGITNLLVLPVSYFCFKINFSPITPFVITIILLFIAYIVNLKVLSHLINEFLFSNLLIETVFKNIVLFLIVFGSVYCVVYYLNEGWLRFFFVEVTNCFCVCICGYFILFKNKDRIYIKNVANRQLKTIINNLVRK
jgi:O-antigen/teichoic acid export membrane protein